MSDRFPARRYLILWIGAERVSCRARFISYDFNVHEDDLSRKQPDLSGFCQPVLKQARQHMPFRYIFPDRH